MSEYDLSPLLIQAAARARESRRADPILADPAAERVLANAGTKPPPEPRRDLAICLRARLVDEAARETLARKPAGVVELGAGLSTRRERLKTELPWHCLERPEVAAWRGRLVPGGGSLVEADLADPAWVRAIKREGGSGPFLFIAEGVFQFLVPETVAALRRGIAETFPGSRLLFDIVSPLTRAAGERGMRWTPETPTEAAGNDERLRVLAVRTLLDLPRSCRRRMPRASRLALRLFPPLRDSHRVVLLGPG